MNEVGGRGVETEDGNRGEERTGELIVAESGGRKERDVKGLDCGGCWKG